MSFFALANIDDPAAARRAFLGKSGLLLSGAAVAMLAGRDALAAASSTSGESDVRILNTALGAELEAIAAYQLGAESKLLQKPVARLGRHLPGPPQGACGRAGEDRGEARRQAGGREGEVRLPDRRSSSRRPTCCRFAAKLEKGAVSAYLGAVPVFGNRDLAKAAASILGDEAMHWAILRNALGESAGSLGLRRRSVRAASWWRP